jgi:hypothetical protein
MTRFLVPAALEKFRTSNRKNLLPPDFAILMPTAGHTVMINGVRCLAAPPGAQEDPENPKNWEQSINHNRLHGPFRAHCFRFFARFIAVGGGCEF